MKKEIQEIIEDSKEIKIENLEGYTEWIKILKQKNQKKINLKTTDQIMREYNKDKWGELYKRLVDRKSEKNKLKFADNFFLQANDIKPFYYEKKFYLNENQKIQDLYFKIVKNTIKKYETKEINIIEFGAGYGSIILKLAEKYQKKKINLKAFEFTESGINCCKYISKSHGLKVNVGQCDFNDFDIRNYDIPEESIFFTSWAMALVDGFPEKMMSEILKYKPKVVIHFEPIKNHWDEKNILEKIWNKYLFLNDYNETLYEDLIKFETRRYIKIINEEKSKFGSNPFCPISIIEWIPNLSL